MDGLILVGALCLVGLGAWWWQRGHQARRAETRLRRICLGDDGQAARMIDAEMRRTPGISRAVAASRAVARYERDNH